MLLPVAMTALAMTNWQYYCASAKVKDVY